MLKGIIAITTWRRDAKRHYNACNGDVEAATAAYKEDLRLRSIDPMTIMVLIQLAIKIWKWAKDNGYLSSYNPSDAPTGYILQTAWDAGEFDGGDDESE